MLDHICPSHPRFCILIGLVYHFMGNRWGNSGNSVRLYFLGSKIPADGDCSHEIKRCLLLRKKVMTNLGSIFKSRDITLPTKVHLVKAMAFPGVIYRCESWTIKKTWVLSNIELCLKPHPQCLPGCILDSWTMRPGVLQSLESQRLRHDWATELNNSYSIFFNVFFSG